MLKSVLEALINENTSAKSQFIIIALNKTLRNKTNKY